MMAQVALVAFALVAMLSIVIDLGMARMTQVQMQNAADTAALEGLRRRNATADLSVDEAARREAARDVVQWTFDDDLNPAAGDPDFQFGAGPVIDLTDGSGTLHAFATMSTPTTHVYKPVLQLNEPNEAYGDQVSGRSCFTADPRPSEGEVHAVPGVDVCGSPQQATGSYARNDFNPGVDDDAFLVRLRRSNEFRELPAQTEPDIGSSGPALPLLFGRGALIQGDNGQFPYSPRRDGLTVRATAIAEAVPAAHVGLPQAATTPALPGVTPFVLDDSFTGLLDPARLPNGCLVTVNADGSIQGATGGPAACPVPGPSIGRFVGALNSPAMVGWAAVITIGQPRPAPRAAACAAVTTITGYAPVTSRLASGTNRIIGFAPVRMTRTAACPPGGGAFTARVVRGPSIVAPANATALLYDGLPVPQDTSDSEIAELLDKHHARNGRAGYGALLVPVLAR